jgi:hypothetical protein
VRNHRREPTVFRDFLKIIPGADDRNRAGFCSFLSRTH